MAQKKYSQHSRLLETFAISTKILGACPYTLNLPQHARAMVLSLTVDAMCNFSYVMGLDVTKPIFGVSDEGRFKPACSATETS